VYNLKIFSGCAGIKTMVTGRYSIQTMQMVVLASD